MDELVNKLSQWVSVSSDAIDACLELTAPFLLEKPTIDPKLQWILRYLALSCNTTSISSLLLINQAQLWDAEILLRSVTEGTIKYVFLCLGNDLELSEKATEYLESLPELDELTSHKRIESFLANVGNPDAPEWDILKNELLSPAEFTNLQSKYPRRTADALRQKWSFNEIGRVLSESNSQIPDFEGLRRLFAYSYGLSSHFIHQDGTAIKIRWHQGKPKEEGFAETGLALAARQLNDLLIMANFRCAMTFKVHKAQAKPVFELFESWQDFFKELATVRQEWWDSRQT